MGNIRNTKPFKVDLTGRRYGRLVVVEYAGKRESGGQQKTLWLCKCDCGKTKIVLGGGLNSGHTTSCGCYHNEKFGDVNRKHNMANKNKLYRVWKGIKERCLNPNNKSYKNYGGRGISVCDEWVNDFKAFYDWSISNGYREQETSYGLNSMTIDRIDNNGDYSPSNCKWSTAIEQANNKRNNRIVKINGVVDTVANFSRKLNIPYYDLLYYANGGKSKKYTNLKIEEEE